MKNYLSTAIIAILFGAAHLLGFWVALGGHPFWSLSATAIGLGVGLFVIFLFWPAPQWRLIVFLALLTGLALYASSLGKFEFAGSYAENRFAGKIWYFGFIGFIAGLFASLSTLLTKLLRFA